MKKEAKKNSLCFRSSFPFSSKSRILTGINLNEYMYRRVQGDRHDEYEHTTEMYRNKKCVFFFILRKSIRLGLAFRTQRYRIRISPFHK